MDSKRLILKTIVQIFVNLHIILFIYNNNRFFTILQIYDDFLLNFFQAIQHAWYSKRYESVTFRLNYLSGNWGCSVITRTTTRTEKYNFNRLESTVVLEVCVLYVGMREALIGWEMGIGLMTQIPRPDSSPPFHRSRSWKLFSGVWQAFTQNSNLLRA